MKMKAVGTPMWPVDENVTTDRYLIIQYKQALEQIVQISLETKGQISGAARAMATLAAEVLPSQTMHKLFERSET